MIKVILTMTVPAQHAAAFEAAWQPAADFAARQKGCLGQVLVRRDEAEPSYLVMSDWTDREAFSEFERSSVQERVTADLRKFRTSARMELYEIVSSRT